MVAEFIHQLREMGVDLRSEGDRLICNAPKGMLSAEMLAEIRKSKPEILEFLQEANTIGSVLERPIKLVSRESDMPPSLMQQRLWYIDQLSPNSSAFNLPAAFRLAGVLDVEALKRSINEIISRHEVLRTAFIVKEGSPRLKIVPSLQIKIDLIDLQGNLSQEDDALMDILITEAKQPFDLAKGPLFRASLFRLDENEHVLFFMAHHIIWDGWSFDIFLHELGVHYEALINGTSASLPELPIQYADYAAWHREWIKGDELQRELAFWRKHLSGDLPILQMPTDHPRPAEMTYKGASEAIEIPREIADSLIVLAQSEDATLFMALLAAYKVFLYRYTDQNDLIIGLPIWGRSRSETENLIGFFVNTLVLRSSLHSELSFRELLKSVRKSCLDIYSYPNTPFEKLVEELQPDRDMSRTPLFQTMFSYQDARKRKTLMADISLNQIIVQNSGSQTDFMLWLKESGTELMGGLEYSTDLYDASTIRRMLDHFIILLDGIVSNPDAKISELPILTDSEKQQLEKWNATGSDRSLECCLHQLFETQVGKSPDKVAVGFEDKQITYEELDQRANQLARYLRALGIVQNSLVGIFIERSIEMMVGLLGILKAGCGYVPLDPDYPLERLDYMMTDAKISVLITQEKLKSGLPDYNGKLICIDADWKKISQEKKDRVVHGSDAPDSDSLAYVIYTSGSTGKPKGVKVPHGAVVNFLNSMRRKPGMTEKDTLLAVTTLSFDIHVLELYLPLVVGGKTVIVSRDVASDGARLTEALVSSDITIMQATPSTWRILLTAGWEGSDRLKILCGGEAFPKDLVRQLIERSSTVWNMYGPTETTVWSTCYELKDADGPVLIGKPIENTQVYILDKQMKQVPVGVPGELYIGGIGVTKGYLNKPELTEQQFIINPIGTGNNDIIYKTGDLVRYRHDGNIEYLNRIDTQVKVRGFRIELEEIETVMNEYEGITQSIVVVKEVRPGDARLIAYFIVHDKSSVDISKLKLFLQKKLPLYMIPQHFVTMDAPFPLTPAGKIDKKVLFDPTIAVDENVGKYIAPGDKVESQLVEIWKQVLDINDVSTNQDFFDLGGHSFLAVEMFAKIQKAFGLQLPLATLFRATTIKQLASVIRDEESAKNWSSLVAIQPNGSKPPLFLIHGAGGNILLYRDLASRLGTDQPVYGLQARGLDGKQDLLFRVEDMAAHYIKEIITVQGNGPYFLGGYCLGGLIAYEIAKQLTEKGEDVALVAMFDTQSKMKKQKYYIKLYQRYQRIVFHIKNFLDVDLNGKILFFKEKLYEIFRRAHRKIRVYISVIAYKIRVRKNRPLVIMETVNDKAAMDYRANSYPGKITVFRPYKTYAGYDDPLHGWGDNNTGEVEIIQLSMLPAGMLLEPFVGELSNRLIDCLKKKQNKHSV